MKGLKQVRTRENSVVGRVEGRGGVPARKGADASRRRRLSAGPGGGRERIKGPKSQEQVDI